MSKKSDLIITIIERPDQCDIDWCGRLDYSDQDIIEILQKWIEVLQTNV